MHALFKSSVVDICKRSGDYFVSKRQSLRDEYSDGREIVYTFDVQGLGNLAQVLERAGVVSSTERPYFKEGDKQALASFLMEDIKKKCPDWKDFLDENFFFRSGNKGYIP